MVFHQISEIYHNPDRFIKLVISQIKKIKNT
jgi:hypothetical protein